MKGLNIFCLIDIVQLLCCIVLKFLNNLLEIHNFAFFLMVALEQVDKEVHHVNVCLENLVNVRPLNLDCNFGAILELA